jgi:outer membrane receptor protein involved in Fe transport
MKIWFRLLLVCVGSLLPLAGQDSTGGSFSGVLKSSDGSPLANAAITLTERATNHVVSSLTTDEQGRFQSSVLRDGDFVLLRDGQTVGTFAIRAENRSVDLGELVAGDESVIQLDKLEVSTRRETFYNAIDRKVYDVGKDITSTTGSASDLLQNIPSVQVDVEGEVSLRGNENVTILINGKTSALMARNTAEALEQMSADRIERVEVITNPSSRYKPDGTGGIINIILKEEGKPGWTTNVRANAGNDDRYNASLSTSYNPGKFNTFGSLSFRRDSRPFFSDQSRIQRDATGAETSRSLQRAEERRRMESWYVEAGGSYKLGGRTDVGASLTYGEREMERRGFQQNVVRSAGNVVNRDYDRVRSGDETDEQFELSLTVEHALDNDGQQLNLELDHESETEEGAELFTDRYRVPAVVDEFERNQNTETESETEFTADYEKPFGSDSKLEAGYSLSAAESDVDFVGTRFDAGSGAWVVDPLTTNRFIYKSVVHALYATYGRPVGPIDILAGLRFEQTFSDAEQVTAAIKDENDFARLYPSLHLSHDLTDTQQIQLSYSHRVQRPDSWDLNPYPRYDDPRNLWAGNPDLEPEDIHSIEAGWQYRSEGITYLASIYQRYRYNGITRVTRLINGDTLLTTSENLDSSRSTGVELGVTQRWRNQLSLNFSGNIYREEISAENLGFSDNKDATAWDAKLNANWEFSKAFTFQVTSGYRAKRLTPQGERRPNHVTNLGARYNFPSRRTSLVLTVSDVFESLKSETVLDTPTLRNETVRTRGPRIVYIGVIHQFGKASKNPGDDLQFDEAM